MSQMSFPNRTAAERRRHKFEKQNGQCHWCKEQMTLEFYPKRANGHVRIPPNFATFEHLQRKRDGGGGKPFNVVLACRRCNNGREAGKQTSKPKPENLAARRCADAELFARLAAGTITAAERGELYTRGLVPNWPMWSKMMATTPLGNP